MVDRRGFLGAVAGTVTATAFVRGQEAARRNDGKSKREVLKPVIPGLPAPPLKADERVNQALAAIRGKYDLPGMIGGILRGETLSAIGAVGVRKLGSDDPMRPGDVV